MKAPVLSWDQTLLAIKVQANLMDKIHEQLPGKENRKERDLLLRPHQAECSRLHYRRIEIVRATPIQSPD